MNKKYSDLVSYSLQVHSNSHMRNARYSQLCNLARLELSGHLGLLVGTVLCWAHAGTCTISNILALKLATFWHSNWSFKMCCQNMRGNEMVFPIPPQDNIRNNPHNEDQTILKVSKIYNVVGS